MDFDVIDFMGFNNRYRQLNSALPGAEEGITRRIDGIQIRTWEPAGEVDDVLVIYHGGGVNSDAGYDIPARQISQRESVCVCLVDMRGHGESSGPEGHISHPEQIWRDVDTVIELLADTFPSARIHLLGHSRGGGMLINYFTRHMPCQKTDSLILLAPELGPFAPANLFRKNASPFASVNKWPFILNALSRGMICGASLAVKLNFPETVLSVRPDFVRRYSVNMANALTPRQPARQISALTLPVSLLFAEQDELTDAWEMKSFIEGCGNPNLFCSIIRQCNHLESIFEASDSIEQHFARFDRLRA